MNDASMTATPQVTDPLTGDVPPEVTYGQVVGRFVRFIADTADVGTVPDEVPLTGTVTLTPLTRFIRFPTTTPPRLAVAEVVVCQVIAGELCPPDGGGPGVFVIATDQPAGSPDTCQWQATFSFDGMLTQPPPAEPSVGSTPPPRMALSPPTVREASDRASCCCSPTMPPTSTATVSPRTPGWSS
jgi:hypothetical protein